MHSFNPTYNGQSRALDIGIINDLDSRWATQLTCAAKTLYPLTQIAQNEPYSLVDGVTNTLQLHGRDRKIANVMFEIKNSLIDTEPGQLRYAKMLAELLSQNLP